MRRFSLIVFLFLLMTTVLFGQVTIRGVVIDSTTSERLVGANVYLVGTALGSATDLEGGYRIEHVPLGNYTLRVSYIGYLNREIPIRLKREQTYNINVSLLFNMVEGKAVTINAQFEGQAAAINQQITSNTIMNVVSEEKIQELPDANAAESIGRLPGVSIIRSGGEANKVILRGLEDKFTVITVDGVKVPPTDATERGVDLSMISQSALAGIELFKAITPDKDGDALAGSINMVTKKAPETRKFKVDLKGDYNNMMKSANQYDFSLRYGERFFNNFLGVQLSGNLEKRIRSNERINVDYDQSLDLQKDYTIDDFLLEFTDEIRKRDGISLLLDMNTPDNGTIRINNVYSRTKRDYLWHSRDYPNTYGGAGDAGSPLYDFRDRKQELNTYSSSIRGNNKLIGLDLNWGLSFAQSKANFPFDYEVTFKELGGMKSHDKFREHPEELISLAVNDFSGANMQWAYFRTQNNFDKERTAFLDVARHYVLSPNLSGEIKIGGKYKIKDRTNSRSENLSPYYLAGQWKDYELLPDGSIANKNFAGTYFEEWQTAGITNIPLSYFLGNPTDRDVYDSYRLYPLIERNRLRQWYELNKNGIDATGNVHEVWTNPLIKYDDYDITERVTAAYAMNTFNIGQSITIIAGVRGEKENNDYLARYMPNMVSGFPVPANSLKDTTSSASQTEWLPNVNVALNPLSFLKFRLAAFKALARPDFNMRMDRLITGRPAEVSSNMQVHVGNPNLKTAQAWNYEINTSLFSNTIGLFSVSVFGKEIKDMFHMLSNFGTSAVKDANGVYQDTLMQRFGIDWSSKMGGSPYRVTLPYNSSKPTKVWGLEFEHQVNLGFLPGLLKNIVLSYNASLVRSETHIWSSKTDSLYYDPPGPKPPSWTFFTVLVEKKQKLESMPEFFGNISLGYDIRRFSGRLSVYHQGKHNISYSANRLSDQVANAFTRLDLAFKQGITENLSLFLNVSNLTNVEDGSSIYNRVYDRKLFNESEKYGLTTDFGIIAQF
jgi:TonB-dependent receptor